MQSGSDSNIEIKQPPVQGEDKGEPEETLEEAGATLSMLGKLTDRSHVAVKLALEAGRGVVDA